jgi:hypothetical protein
VQRLRHYWRSFVLLGVAVGLGLVAVVLLPSGTPAPAPGSIGLVVSETVPMQSLNIWESQTPAGERVFDFVVNGPVVHLAGVPDPSLLIDLSYPTNNTASCNPAWRCHMLPKHPYLPLQVTLVDDHRGQGSTEYFARVVFSGPPLGIDSDSTSATAELPAVQLPLAQDFLIGAVEVHYTLEDARAYEWTTGERPISTTGNTMKWYLNLASQNSSLGPVYASVGSSAGAVNQTASQHEQFLIFLAGALVGVAGGALVGALQELLDAREKKKTGGVLEDPQNNALT